MLYFFLALSALIIGYFIYGTFIDKFFGPRDNEDTPANNLRDDIDYVPMHPAKVFLIQVLNIAGVGPIFGPILGALYGPIALVWIVIGCIFAGAVHDYFSGMLSIRNNGATAPTFITKYLGEWSKHLMRLFTLVLLIFVAIVFVLSPAKLLNGLIPHISVPIFITVIFGYYFLATVLPVSKIIGRLYPVFASLLAGMTLVLLVALIFSEHQFYSIVNNGFAGNHPNNLPIWPLVFITIACGALSGFHSTQSPIMARCVTNEKFGKMTFYGGMIVEGIIALIWATLAMSFYYDTNALFEVTSSQSPAGVVKEVSYGLLGTVGGFMAVLAVIILPITSGDTAFRSCRLIIAEIFNIDQKIILKRLMIAIPLFIIGFFMSRMDFDVIWRYFGVSNQFLASMMLWTAAAYLAKENKLHLIASVPATFITAVCITYIAMDTNLGFGINYTISVTIGAISSITLFVAFVYFYVIKGKNETTDFADYTEGKQKD